MSGSIAKPQLRNLHVAQIKKNLLGMTIFCITCTLGYKILFCDSRVKKYEEFYKNYDPEAVLKKMCESGYMESCGNGK